MEHRHHCRFCLGGDPSISGILFTLWNIFPFVNGSVIQAVEDQATVEFDRASNTSPFGLTITAESEAACLSLQARVLRELGATIYRANTFVVWVDYRSHGIKHTEFADCASAQWECRKLIEEYIDDLAGPGVPVEEIMRSYEADGIALQILSEDSSQCSTPAAEYASQRARERAGDLWNEATVKHHDEFHLDLIKTGLASQEIFDRVHAIGEPRTYGKVTTAGGVYLIPRLPDGCSAVSTSSSASTCSAKSAPQSRRNSPVGSNRFTNSRTSKSLA